MKQPVEVEDLEVQPQVENSTTDKTQEKGGKIEHPSSEDWRAVNVFLKFLEIIYQTNLKFSSMLHVTSNTFFHELFNFQNIIVNYSKCDDSLLTGMAKKMKGKFDKY